MFSLCPLFMSIVCMYYGDEDQKWWTMNNHNDELAEMCEVYRVQQFFVPAFPLYRMLTKWWLHFVTHFHSHQTISIYIYLYTIIHTYLCDSVVIHAVSFGGRKVFFLDKKNIRNIFSLCNIFDFGRNLSKLHSPF